MWSLKVRPWASRPYPAHSAGKPVNACTWSASTGARARKTAGPQNHPTMVRWFTEAGYRQFSTLPSGARTCSGRKHPAFDGISGVRIDFNA